MDLGQTADLAQMPEQGQHKPVPLPELTTKQTQTLLQPCPTLWEAAILLRLHSRIFAGDTEELLEF